MRDRAWIRLMVSGDKMAGEEFVRRYYARIERLLGCLTGSPDTARDLTQQTFVKAWQALPGFKHEAGLQTWLHKIAYHEYTHWLRDRRDHAPLEAACDVADPSANIVINDWGLALLPNALAQLSEELRDTFLLFYVQELDVKQIADVLNVPRGTVKSRLFTARQKLRGLLAHELRDPDTVTKSERGQPKSETATQRYAADIPAAYRVEPESAATLPPGQNRSQNSGPASGGASDAPQEQCLTQPLQSHLHLQSLHLPKPHPMNLHSPQGHPRDARRIATGQMRGLARYAGAMRARLMGEPKGGQG